MQFVALRSDRPLPPEFRENYVHVRDVECQKCKRVTYQLYAPILETEPEQVRAQAEWLIAHLPKVCPDHPDWFLTLDRPGR